MLPWSSMVVLLWQRGLDRSYSLHLVQYTQTLTNARALHTATKNQEKEYPRIQSKWQGQTVEMALWLLSIWSVSSSVTAEIVKHDGLLPPRQHVRHTSEPTGFGLLIMTDARSVLTEQDIQKKIQETRKRFCIEYAQDSSDKYDSRDVDRLWKDDVLVDGYLEWRHFVVEDTLKMIDESLQWRKEFKLNDINESSVQKSLFESGMHYLHGYDKEGNKLFWFRVKLHMKDVKMLTEKKRYVAFWLESYARREPGIPLTVIFDMSEAGLSCVVRCLLSSHSPLADLCCGTWYQCPNILC